MHRQYRSGRVAGVVAREVRRRRSDLLRSGEPAHRDVPEPALALLRAEALEHRPALGRLHRPEPERVDPDAVTGQVRAEVAAELVDGCLGRRERHLCGGGAHLGEERPGEDHRSAGSPHERYGVTHAVLRRRQDPAEHSLPDLVRRREHAVVLGIEGTGVHVQHVDRPVLVTNAGEHLARLLVVAQVRVVRRNGDVDVDVATVDPHHASALVGEPGGHRLADHPADAGHHADPTLEPTRPGHLVVGHGVILPLGSAPDGQPVVDQLVPTREEVVVEALVAGPAHRRRPRRCAPSSAARPSPRGSRWSRRRSSASTCSVTQRRIVAGVQAGGVRARELRRGVDERAATSSPRRSRRG